MRGFVGIDAGVFDQNFARRDFAARLVVTSQRSGQFSALHLGVDVAGAGQFELLEAIEWSDAVDDLFRNLAGSLAQPLGQLERQRKRVLAQFHSRRLFHDNLRQVKPVGAAKKVAEMLRQPAFEMTIQEAPSALGEDSDSNRVGAAWRFDGNCRVPYDENQPAKTDGKRPRLCVLLTSTVFPESAATCFLGHWWTPVCPRDCSRKRLRR